MSKPKLVQMAGFPGAGKTRIARYLSRKLGAPRISTDDLREMLYGKRYPDDIGKELGLPNRYGTTRTEEDYMCGTAKRLQIWYLLEGIGSIVDFSSPNNKGRAWVFDTKSPTGTEVEVDKYLIVVQVDENVLRTQREHPESVDRWKRVWEEPDNKGYQTIVLQNNTKWGYRRALRTAFRALTDEENPKIWREKLKAEQAAAGESL